MPILQCFTQLRRFSPAYKEFVRDKYPKPYNGYKLIKHEYVFRFYKLICLHIFFGTTANTFFRFVLYVATRLHTFHYVSKSDLFTLNIDASWLLELLKTTSATIRRKFQTKQAICRQKRMWTPLFAQKVRQLS